MPGIKHRIRPGPGRCVLKLLAPDQEHALGDGKTLWVPRPASHEGYVAEVVDPGLAYVTHTREGGVHTQEPNYARGQIVLIGKYTGMKVTLNRTDELVLCKEQDIIGELIEEEEGDDAQLSLEP